MSTASPSSIPFELGITLDDALEKEPELSKLYQAEDEVKNLIDLARSLEGLTRNAGMHAGGVVIAPSVLTDFTPLYCDASGGGVDHPVRQGRRRGRRPGQVRLPGPAHAHDHRPRRGADQPRARCRRRRCWTSSRLPMDDAATYALLKSCRTTRGVPARVARHEGPHSPPAAGLASRTSWRWWRCSARVPLQSGMVDDFIDRKHGRSTARSTTCTRAWSGS